MGPNSRPKPLPGAAGGLCAPAAARVLAGLLAPTGAVAASSPPAPCSVDAARDESLFSRELSSCLKTSEKEPTARMSVGEAVDATALLAPSLLLFCTLPEPLVLLVLPPLLLPRCSLVAACPDGAAGAAAPDA